MMRPLTKPLLVLSIVSASWALSQPSRAQAVGPVPDAGIADAGIASLAIKNVAANDTVNGAPATLGASGNATIVKYGTWPTGLQLTPSNGALYTSASLAAGGYSVAYLLCNKSKPPVCASTTDMVTVQPASIMPAGDMGYADAGIASLPISSITANDTVHGAPATLGNTGNATVAKSGTWPTGLVLNTNGSIGTTKSLAVGTYAVTYNLCDRNVPPVCATAPATIVVSTASIMAIADTGTFSLAVASTPIANVAANDTLNGASATLGQGGNATVAQSGPWPNGIVLNTVTGAVTASAAVPAGSFTFTYKLCDRNTPAQCATASDTIASVGGLTAAVSDMGLATLGVSSTPIANVAANDSMNGLPATLGAGGNAVVTQIGNWPGGISLDPLAGTISTAGTVAGGVYQLQYQLCDVNSASNCATATDTVLVSPAFVEVQESPQDFGDIEFDWGRDGVYCATCNFGEGNARFTGRTRAATFGWVTSIRRPARLPPPTA